MVGLDAAGKTTILYKLKLGELEKLMRITLSLFHYDDNRSLITNDSEQFHLFQDGTDYFILQICKEFFHHFITVVKCNFFLIILGEIVTTIPTIGFNVETVEYKNISFTVWGKLYSNPTLCNPMLICSVCVCLHFRCWWSRQNPPIVETLFPEYTRLDLCGWQ